MALQFEITSKVKQNVKSFITAHETDVDEAVNKLTEQINDWIHESGVQIDNTDMTVYSHGIQHKVICIVTYKYDTSTDTLINS